MTFNEFAVLVSKKEGLKKQIDIAQIKEILKIIFTLLHRIGVNPYILIRSVNKKRFYAS